MKKCIAVGCMVIGMVWGLQVQAHALSIIDPVESQYGSIVAYFSGNLQEGLAGRTTRWPSGWPPEGRLYDYNLPIDTYTYGARFDSYYAQSTIDRAAACIVSEVNHPGACGVASSGVTLYTHDVPTSGVFTRTGGAHATSAAMGMQVLDGDVILGEIGYLNDNGNLSWLVNHWSYVTVDPALPPELIQVVLYAHSGELDFSQLRSYVQAIVDGRSDDYYFAVFANAYSADQASEGSMSARLDFSSVPSVPEPATMILGCIGLGALVLQRKK